MHKLARAMLLHAVSEERTATGSDRRTAFRATRFLVAGLLDNDVPAASARLRGN